MDTSKMPATRAEAKAQGARYYFTGVPCKHGHIAPRKTKGACVECLRVEWAAAAEIRAEYFREYNKSDKAKENKQRYYAANRDVVIARAAARPAAEKRAAQAAWREANPDYVRASTKSRRRKHRQATPLWLTLEQKAEMRKMYETAIRLSRTTGEPYVVDHIYPLRSEVVCGLHVPWNLRVMTREANLRKSNNMPDDSEALAFPRGACHNEAPVNRPG